MVKRGKGRKKIEGYSSAPFTLFPSSPFPPFLNSSVAILLVERNDEP